MVPTLSGIRRGQVEIAVVVEIAGDHVRVADECRVQMRLEGPIPVAEQDARGARVHGGDIGLAVVVEVADDELVGTGAGGVGRRGSEGAVAVAQQDVHALRADDGKVDLAVAVEVPGPGVERSWPRPRSRLSAGTCRRRC